MTNLNEYVNPLVERYASGEMIYNFSHNRTLSTQRDLWIALAESQKELGLPITDEQITELKLHKDDINYEEIIRKEKEVRHDIVARIYAYGLQCPKAKPIIHLGATSAFITDNLDLIVMRDGLLIIRKKLLNVISALRDFALEHKDLPTLSFTHFQPAQLTTVGKRASLWLHDLLIDFHDIEHRTEVLKFRGVKGTTGTQASFLVIFDGDEEKVKKLDSTVAQKMGFEGSLPITGQTYTRKIDSQIAGLLSGISQSAHKFGNDIRILQGLKEIEEPFEKDQVGSSVMAYKRNPMRCERICALSRYVITTSQSPDFTAASQWLERTLDDSANKRITIPEMFLAVDAILILLLNVTTGLVVYPRMIERHIREELPFMATENIIVEMVKRGGDRQEAHERIRKHSMEAGRRVKEDGLDNDFLDRISKDPYFDVTEAELLSITDPKSFIGRAPSQVKEFVQNEVDPILEENSELLGIKAELRV